MKILVQCIKTNELRCLNSECKICTFLGNCRQDISSCINQISLIHSIIKVFKKNNNVILFLTNKLSNS